MTGRRLRLTRRGRVVFWIVAVIVAVALYRYADAMFAECMARIGDRVECSIH